MSVNLFPDTNEWVDGQSGQRQRQKKCTGLITKVIPAITINQCIRVLNTVSFSEDQTATWWQMISLELFLYEGTKMCSYWNRYLFYGFAVLVHHVSHSPTRHRITKCFVCDHGIIHNTVSLFYRKSSKAVSNVHEGLLFFPCTPLSTGAGATER